MYELLNEAKINGDLETVMSANDMTQIEHDQYLIIEDDSNYYINMNTGLGFGQYAKADFTLDDAIKNQEGMYE